MSVIQDCKKKNAGGENADLSSQFLKSKVNKYPFIWSDTFWIWVLKSDWILKKIHISDWVGKGGHFIPSDLYFDPHGKHAGRMLFGAEHRRGLAFQEPYVH